MRGHPVFIAQHATATCCRECIRKWHKMQPGKELSRVQQDYLVDVIMTPILYENQIVPIPLNQTALDSPAEIWQLYVPQSLLQAPPENYILLLIWKEMQ